MKCNDYIIWISGHIDGTNSKKDEQILQDHLAVCPHCRQVLTDMKANETAMKDEELTPPLRIAQNVMATVRKDATAKKRARFRNYFVSVAAAAAVLCLVLVATFRIPEQLSADPGARSLDMPTEAISPAEENREENPPAYGGTEAEPNATEVGIASTESTYSTRHRRPEKNISCHCVFVELPSYDAMPKDLPLMTTEDILSCITREASDHYFYGGSMIYGATEMSYDELAQWEDMIQFRFLQEFEETDTYIVVFCSESR